MDAPTIITQLEPVSECVQQLSAWVEMHFWFLTTVAALAVIGGLGILDYGMRIVLGLGERAWECWRKPSAQKDKA